MQKRNAELVTVVGGDGRERQKGLVMRVEGAVELGMWLPEGMRERGVEGDGEREDGEGGEDSGVVEWRKWKLEVRFERAEGNEGMVRMEN